MTKTIMTLLLATALAACGQDPSTLTIQGLSEILTETERAELRPHLDRDTLDLSTAQIEYRAIWPVIHAWASHLGPLSVRASFTEGKDGEVRVDGQRAECASKTSETSVTGRRIHAHGAIDCRGAGPREFELILDAEDLFYTESHR